jgi:aryl-alcohol dehydrogenase-like predicted oxidoreductase
VISRRRTEVVGILIDAALDAGINFIYTADVYSAGDSEELVGKAPTTGERDDVVLATPAERRLDRPQSHVPPWATCAGRCGSACTQ